MYQQFFNFNTAPFSIAPDPHFIYMSEQHQEGLAHLLYGINQGGGFVALTGEVGTGKTTLCQCLLQQLPDNIDIALVLNPKLNAIELLATICDELNINYEQDKLTLKGLVDNLNNYLLSTHASGRRSVLVIDEAQNLSFNVLEQIRLLTNLETSTTKLLQIILLGQPELKQLLEKPALRQLNQRITGRYHLSSLSYSDTQHYIKHRLKISGGNPNIFNRRAIKKIHKLSQGIPRLINTLCDRALLGAYVNGTQIVTMKIINVAAKEIISDHKPSIFSRFKKIILVSLAISILAGLSYSFIPDKEPTQRVILSGSFEPQAKRLDFNTELEARNTSLNMAIPQLAKLWGKQLSQGAGCKEIEETGLSCLFDKSNWNELKALNRPVIMEFSLSNTQKTYALLVGVEQGRPVFFNDEQTAYPLEQVISYWDGYYLMLWQPPVQAVTTVSPGTSSDVVLWIRNILTVNNEEYSKVIDPALFDNSLKKAVIAFQEKHHLTPDGIVGPRTFIHLKNTAPLNPSPKLRLLK